jgi:GTPase
MENNFDIDSIETHLLFLGVEKDQPEYLNENFIQHKIDAKDLSQIKWSKLQSLIDETIHQYHSCHYELRIYNIDSDKETISHILSNVKSISKSLNCTCDIIKTKEGIFGIFFEFLINEIKNELTEKENNIIIHQNEVKIGVFGEESSGKSTTLSVIVNEELDDGNGKMRKLNFRFQHEFISGKTLSISHLIFGLDKNNNRIHTKDNSEMIKNSYKLINLYDMGGSEKAMKNTLSLISPDYIDYALLFVDVKNGPTYNTKILYTLNNSIHIPMIAIVTMIDLFVENPLNQFNKFLDNFIKVISHINPSLKPILIQNKNDIFSYLTEIKNSNNQNLLPIIPISNVKGTNIDLLSFLISNLPNTLSRTIPLINNSFDDKGFNFISSPQSQFDVHEHFIVDGKTIIGGVVSKGKIKKGEKYYFGPNKMGNFKLLTVDTIHCKKQNVNIAYEGQFSSVSLSGNNFSENEVIKGMSLIGINNTPRAIKIFKADVWSIGDENIKEVKYRCEPVIIINHIRQTCKILCDKNKKNNCNEDANTTISEYSKSSFLTSDFEFEDDSKKKKKRRIKVKGDETFFISKNEKIELRFEFKNSPEYLCEGSNVIINDNNFKAFGIVTKVFYSDK